MLVGLVELVVAQGPRLIACVLALAGRSGAGTSIVFENVAFTFLQQSNVVLWAVHFPRTAVALLFLMIVFAWVGSTYLVLQFKFDSGPEQRHTYTLSEFLLVLLPQAPRLTLFFLTVLGKDGAETLIVEHVFAVVLVVLVLFTFLHRQQSNLVLLSWHFPMAATLVSMISNAFFFVTCRVLQVSAVSGPWHWQMNTLRMPKKAESCALHTSERIKTKKIAALMVGLTKVDSGQQSRGAVGVAFHVKLWRPQPPRSPEK